MRGSRRQCLAHLIRSLVSSEQRIGKVQTCNCGGEIYSVCVIGNRGKHYHSEMRGFRRIDTFVGS